MDISQLPISQLAPYDKELRLATKINSLHDAMIRYNLVDRDPDVFHTLESFRDDIVGWHDVVFSSLDSSTFNERKTEYFIPEDAYKVMYDYVKQLGTVKDFISALQNDDEKTSTEKKYTDIELEKINHLKNNRLIKARLDFKERMKIEALEAAADNDYLIFSTLTAAPGQEHIFDVGNKEVKGFIRQFQMDVANAYLLANGQKSTDRARRLILSDVARYLRVYEYGDQNGRCHVHIFWRIKALPDYISNPHDVNRISDYDFRQTLPAMAELWRYGISHHQPLRFGGCAWTKLGFPAQKQLTPAGAVEQKPVMPIDACVSYVANYIHKAFEVDLALRTYNFLNKSDDVYNKDNTNEETKKWRVKTSQGFGKLRVRQLIAKAPIKRLRELLIVSPQLEPPPPPPNIHLPSWRLLRTELLRRLVREGTLRPYYLELRHLPNLFQAALTDPLKQIKILSYALMSSGRLAAPVIKSTAACEQMAVNMLIKFYDDFILPLDCSIVVINGRNYG